MSPMPNPAVDPADAADIIDAAQAALAGEHACVYGYGVVGSHLDEEDRDPVWRALTAHEEHRAALRRRLLALDVAPVAALPAYALPFRVDDARSARKLARTLETRLAALYADLIATGPARKLRRLAANGLVDATVRAARWGAEVPAFPGLDGRADSDAQ